MYIFFITPFGNLYLEIMSGVLTMKDSTSKIPVTKSTGDTRPEKEETWTLRNTVIFLSMCLVYFALFAAYSVYAPFLPSEVSKIHFSYRVEKC